MNSISESTELTVLPIQQSDRILELDADTEQPDIPAYITHGPEDCTVLIGGTVALDVHYGGYPHPDVKWMRAVSYICALNILIFDTKIKGASYNILTF